MGSKSHLGLAVQVAAKSHRDAREDSHSDEASERSASKGRPRRPTPQLTRTGAITGTPNYIAPELGRRGARLTPAVDVFAFGVVAYRVLTGKAPDAEPPLHARLDGREPQPHVPVTTLCPNLPPQLATLLDACLAPLPGHRPDIPTLLQVLDAAMAGATAADSASASRAGRG